jgi:hypothetical protein
VHLAMDEATLEVRAVAITGSGVGDAPMLPSLLDRTPEGEPIASVTADGAQHGRACRDAFANRGADAAIPPRRDARPRKKDSPPARDRETRPCAPSSGSAARSGAGGAATTGAAASRRR